MGTGERALAIVFRNCRDIVAIAVQTSISGSNSSSQTTGPNCDHAPISNVSEGRAGRVIGCAASRSCSTTRHAPQRLTSLNATQLCTVPLPFRVRRCQKYHLVGECDAQVPLLSRNTISPHSHTSSAPAFRAGALVGEPQITRHARLRPVLSKRRILESRASAEQPLQCYWRMEIRPDTLRAR